jgi:hypothetical protein
MRRTDLATISNVTSERTHGCVTRACSSARKRRLMPRRCTSATRCRDDTSDRRPDVSADASSSIAVSTTRVVAADACDAWSALAWSQMPLTHSRHAPKFVSASEFSALGAACTASGRNRHVSTAAVLPTAISLERKEIIAAASGQLVTSALTLLGASLGRPEPAAAQIQQIKDSLLQCVETDAEGRSKLSLKLPDAGSLDQIAKALAMLIQPPA